MGPEIQGQEATFEFRCWRLLTSSLSRGRKLSTGTSMTRMGLVLKPQPGLILGHLPGHLLQVAGTAGQFPGRWALTVAIPYNSLLTAHLSPLYRRAFMPGALPSLLPRGSHHPDSFSPCTAFLLESNSHTLQLSNVVLHQQHPCDLGTCQKCKPCDATPGL